MEASNSFRRIALRAPRVQAGKVSYKIFLTAASATPTLVLDVAPEALFVKPGAISFVKSRLCCPSRVDSEAKEVAAVAVDVSQDNWLVKTPGPFTESGGLVTLFQAELGYDPLAVRGVHVFQLYDTTGGSVVLDVMGPGGEWYEHTTGITEDDVVTVTGYYSGFRFTFTTTGGAGKIAIHARAQGW